MSNILDKNSCREKKVSFGPPLESGINVFPFWSHFFIL